MPIIGKQSRKVPLEEEYLKYGLDPENIPKHIAIIMDGNGRWAKQRNLPRIAGHKQGMETFRSMIRACVDFNIHYLTVYAFSTENWKRPKAEVDFLMSLLKSYINSEIKELMKENARITFRGRTLGYSKSLEERIAFAENKTKNNNTIQVNVMINYGSRAEITDAIKQMGQELIDNTLSLEDINDDTLSKYLYCADTPDPEILIRTSDEKRISNFLLWQISYSELFFTKTYWPDFSKDELGSILKQYQERNRRFGGL